MKKLVYAFLSLMLCLLLHGYSYGQEVNDTIDGDSAIGEEPQTRDNRSENEAVAADEEDKTAAAEIVITATKTGIRKKETGASITVITAEEIEQKKKNFVVDMLKDTAGISVTQSSPLGGIADLNMRGTASNHVTVLIDGVKVNDPSQAGHGFDFAHLSTDNIERIEIVRGSQSVLYGSDAIGGGINIITKKGEGKPKVSIKAEGGSFKTFKESAGVSGGTDWAYYSFNVARTDSQGFTRTSSWKGIRKSFLRRHYTDGYDNTAVSTNLGIKTLHDSWLSFTLRFTDANMDIANGAYEEDKNHTFHNQNLAFNVKYSIPIFQWWESSLVFSYMNQLTRDKNLPDFYEYATSVYNYGAFASFGYSNMTFHGKLMAGEWKNTFSINDMDEIVCGVSYEKEYAQTVPYWFSFNEFFSAAMDGTAPIDKNAGTWAVYAQNHLKLYKRIFVIAGARYTRPDHFHDSVDFGVSGSFIVPVAETRFKASVGSGYKIPSLYQLYNAFERFNRYTFAYLNPEETLSYDIGIEQPLWEKKITFEINYFSIDYINMIVYDTNLDNWGRYWNSNALTRGVECIASITPIDDLTFRGYYTFTRAHDKTLHTGDLLRRPRHQAGVSVNYAFLQNGNVNLSFTYVGARRDYWRYPYFNRMDSYYKFDLAASWWIIEQLQAYIRIENVLDRKYEEVRGYRAAPCSVYGGLKAEF
ncbi:MAG: TonB-dependent receptor [Spirochaetes bacterium]|nr:TonB-dependent receptor [Spirochaetota bacterium]